MKTEYEKQAEDFLSKTGTKLTVKFKTYDKYFADDKESRNIYNITLRRGKKSYTFTFGASINDTQNNIEPSAYDVLACLEKCEYTDFEDFCCQLGYDVDSRKAEKTYKACKKQYERLTDLFDEAEMMELQEIQ